MIRPATLDDAMHCATLGLKFINAAGMPPATIEQCVEFCVRMIPLDIAGVFVSPQGVIAGVVTPLYYNPNWTQAVELWWWAEDGNGLRLLEAFETWAWSKGADDINMSTLAHFTPKGVDKLLARRGYELRDQTYRKGASK